MGFNTEVLKAFFTPVVFIHMSTQYNKSNENSIIALTLHTIVFILALSFTYFDTSLLNNNVWDVILITLLSSLVGHSISVVKQ